MAVQSKIVGASGQISIGKQYAGQQVIIEEIEPGEWRIQTAITIPKSQAWVHTQAVQACHDLLEWIIPQLDKFPRVRRYTLGERLETTLLSVLEGLLAAAYGRDKSSLAAANLHLDLARHLWRLAYRLQAVPLQRYEHGARLMLELGRQIGGWRRADPRQGGSDAPRG